MTHLMLSYIDVMIIICTNQCPKIKISVMNCLKDLKKKKSKPVDLRIYIFNFIGLGTCTLFFRGRILRYFNSCKRMFTLLNDNKSYFLKIKTFG
jgi:hypothetical protein